MRFRTRGAATAADAERHNQCEQSVHSSILIEPTNQRMFLTFVREHLADLPSRSRLRPNGGFMKKALLVMGLLSAGGYVTWQWTHDSAPVVQDDESLTLDRLWVDHIPRNDKDSINLFVALTEQPVGVFQKTSQWQGAYEIFMFEHHANELRITYPQTSERETVKVKATTCNEGQMDYCLEMENGSRGVKRYYSRKGWEVQGNLTGEQLKAHADVMLHQLAK
jgi:hypothetical protein